MEKSTKSLIVVIAIFVLQTISAYYINEILKTIHLNKDNMLTVQYFIYNLPVWGVIFYLTFQFMKHFDEIHKNIDSTQKDHLATMQGLIKTANDNLTTSRLIIDTFKMDNMLNRAINYKLLYKKMDSSNIDEDMFIRNSMENDFPDLTAKEREEIVNKLKILSVK